MASRFLGKSWFRLRPLVDQDIIAEPIWLKVAETFPPLPPPSVEAKKKEDIRNLFPEEVQRRRIDMKYRMDQTHPLRETESVEAFGREELRKELDLLLENGMKEELAWQMGIKRLWTQYRISATNVEEEVKIRRLLKLKKLAED